MDGLVERKKKEIRDKIISVAGELFKRQGFDNTTMDQIASEAAMARKTLYNYFPVKEAIADEYVRSASEGKAEEMSEKLLDLPDTRSRLIAAINNRYDWLEMNPDLCRIVLMYRMKTFLQGSFQEFQATGTQQHIIDILCLGQKTGEISADIPIKMLFSYIDQLRTVVVLDWLNGKSQVDLREQTARLVDLVLYGACAQAKEQ